MNWWLKHRLLLEYIVIFLFYYLFMAYIYFVVEGHTIP